MQRCDLDTFQVRAELPRLPDILISRCLESGFILNNATVYNTEKLSARICKRLYVAQVWLSSEKLLRVLVVLSVSVESLLVENTLSMSQIGLL